MTMTNTITIDGRLVSTTTIDRDGDAIQIRQERHDGRVIEHETSLAYCDDANYVAGIALLLTNKHNPDLEKKIDE